MKYAPCALGLAAMLVFAAPCFGASQGPYYPQEAQDDDEIGALEWENPNYIKTNDDLWANANTSVGPVTDYSHYLKANNFGFSIPSGSTINGITVEIKRTSGMSGSTIYDEKIRIVKGGEPGLTDKSNPDQWIFPPFGDYEVITYGGEEELWGETWSPSDINSSSFGVAVQTKQTGGYEAIGSAYIDYIRVSIDYSEPPPPVTRLRNSTWRNATIR